MPNQPTELQEHHEALHQIASSAWREYRDAKQVIREVQPDDILRDWTLAYQRGKQNTAHYLLEQIFVEHRYLNRPRLGLFFTVEYK